MTSQTEDRKFDSRLIDKRIRRGTLTSDEFSTYLDSLPDEEEEAQECEVRFEAIHASRLANADAEEEAEPASELDAGFA